MIKELIYKNDLGDILEKITLPTGQYIYLVIRIDIGSGGDVLDVKEYKEIPTQMLREIKLRKLLDE